MNWIDPHSGTAWIAGGPVGILLQAAPGAHVPDFQPHIFLAYGAACLLLLGFSVWTVAQSRRLEARIRYLRERFRSAHPEILDEEGNS